ncbi:Fip1 motif domain containing protein [Elaphomyces granulatus]|jgi:pre-mRNA 3'-end-processing factor FIP1
MEEEDDDLYDPAETLPATQLQADITKSISLNTKPPQVEEIEEVVEEIDEDEDEFNIITEAPPEPTPAEIVQHPRFPTLRNEPAQAPSVDSATAAKPSTPVIVPRVETSAFASAKLAAPLKPGSAYPATHTSTIDVNANPIHPSTGKPLHSTDLDADFPTEDDKPWRRPGTDITDYFNYGFDEFTWASYCLKQQELRKDVSDQKKQLEEMQTFLNMGGGLPGLPGAPPGAPAPSATGSASTSGQPSGLPSLPGMPDISPEMMQGMLASMMAQGLDPLSMDAMSFGQHVHVMMGGGQSGAGSGQQAQTGFSGQSQGQAFGGQGANQQQMGFAYNQQGAFGTGRGRGGGGRRW